VNGDDWLDIAVGNFLGSGLAIILLNKGDGTFGPPVSYATGIHSVDFILHDLDGDDWLDIAVANDTPSYDRATVLLNNGDGTFGDAFGYETGNWALNVAATDIDNDNWVDLAVACYDIDDETNTVAVLFSLCPNSCPADFDDDGDVDTTDLMYLLATWGTPDGDVDDDGDTDTADLLALLAAWGECP